MLENYLRLNMAHLVVEQLRVIFLSAKLRLLADEVISWGTIDSCTAAPRDVLRRALDLGSTAIVLVHNHPSGDPAPSRQDIELTRKMLAAAKLFDIQLMDHVVVASSGLTSMKELRYI